MQWLSASIIITDAGGIIGESRYENVMYETFRAKGIWLVDLLCSFVVLFCSFADVVRQHNMPNNLLSFTTCTLT